MKTTLPLLALALASVVTVSGQTLTDDFSTGVNWAGGHASNSVIAIADGVAGYTTTEDDNEASLMLTARTFSYTSDWEAQVDVHAALAASLTVDEEGYFYGSLFATPTGSVIGFSEPPATSYYSADMVRGGADQNLFQTSWWLAGIGEYEDGLTGNILTTDAAVRLAFDSTDKVISAFYDADGATGGYTWTGLGSIDIDGAQNWGLDSGDTISLGLLVFNAYGATPADVRFDNFSATAIPEPSTYAALAGLLALGGVIWKRRRAA
jgi:hypothetical protein